MKMRSVHVSTSWVRIIPKHVNERTMRLIIQMSYIYNAKYLHVCTFAQILRITCALYMFSHVSVHIFLFLLLRSNLLKSKPDYSVFF